MLTTLIAAINRKLPTAPPETRLGFAEVAPWLAILTAALGLLLGGRGALLLFILPDLPKGVLPSPFIVAVVAPPILALASVAGLFTRERWGWILFTIAVVLDLILAFTRLDLFGILFGLVFTYLLLQSYEAYASDYRPW